MREELNKAKESQNPDSPKSENWQDPQKPRNPLERDPPEKEGPKERKNAPLDPMNLFRIKTPGSPKTLKTKLLSCPWKAEHSGAFT